MQHNDRFMVPLPELQTKSKTDQGIDLKWTCQHKKQNKTNQKKQKQTLLHFPPNFLIFIKVYRSHEVPKLAIHELNCSEEGFLLCSLNES